MLPGADLLPGTAESSPAKQLCKNAPTLLMLVSFVPHSALERLSCISGQAKTSRCYQEASLQQANGFGEAQAGCWGMGAGTHFPKSWALDSKRNRDWKMSPKDSFCLSLRRFCGNKGKFLFAAMPTLSSSLLIPKDFY